MKLFIAVVVAAVCIGVTSGLFSQCSQGKGFENLESNVNVSGCKKTYCRLRKKTLVDVIMKFKPDRDIKSLTNTVSADIAGIPFPFLGVDGTSACNQVFEADGETKARCPLKAGTQYVYKNVINILEVYPRLKIIVHWGLTAPHGDIMCFEVPARITN